MRVGCILGSYYAYSRTWSLKKLAKDVWRVVAMSSSFSILHPSKLHFIFYHVYTFHTLPSGLDNFQAQLSRHKMIWVISWERLFQVRGTFEIRNKINNHLFNIDILIKMNIHISWYAPMRHMHLNMLNKSSLSTLTYSTVPTTLHIVVYIYVYIHSRASSAIVAVML